MEHEEIAELRYDLHRLEDRVAALQHRVTALEGGQASEAPAPETQPIAPPPIVTIPVAPIRPPSDERRPVVPPPVPEFAFGSSRPMSPPPTMPPISRPAPAPAKAADAEYRIGAVILPRVGAGVVLVAIGTFVSMAISRGWIDQWTQFWLGILTCLAFVGVGLWKRNEQEEFGQLLIGIGSCGLYLAFTAGHVFLHRYPRETLVELFLGLSLVNLWYSNLVSSRSFLAIGMIGGLAAATMPMAEQRLALSVVLHFAIVIPAALIIMKNRWSTWAMALWLFAMVALVPAMLYDGDWRLRIAALYGSTLICATAYCFTGESGFDPENAFAPIVLFLAALVGMFWIRGGHEGAAHVIMLGAVTLALGAAFRSRTSTAGRLLLVGVAIPFTIAPWGFEHWQASFILQAQSIVCAIAAMRIAPKQSVALGWLLFLLGVCAYVIALAAGREVPWSVEGALLTLTITAALIGAWGLNRLHGSPEWIALGACLLALPVFTRLAFVTLNLSPAGFGMYTSLLIGWMIFSFFVNVVAARSRWLPPMAASWLTLLQALAFYVPLAAVQPLGEGQDALLIVGLMATTLMTTAVAKGFAAGENAEEMVLFGAVLILPLFSRLAWVLLTPLGFAGLTALILAWMVYSLILSGLTAWKRWTSACGASWLVLLLAMAAYIPLAEQQLLSQAADVALILALMAAAVVSTVVTRLVDDARPIELLVNGAGCLVLPLFSRLAYVVLSPAGLDVQSTLTIGWISYSVAACAVALRLRWNGTAALAGVVALLAGCAYFAQIVDRAPAFGTDLVLVLALLGNLGFASFAIGRRGGLGFTVPGLVTTTGFIVLPAFSRLAWLCLTQWGVSSPAALVFGWVAFSLAASALVWRSGWVAPAVLSWLCIAMSAGVYVAEIAGVGSGVGEEMALLTGMLIATLGAALACCRVAADPAVAICVGACACWALFTRWAVVLLTAPAFGVHFNGAVTLSWSIYATILMSWGFLGHVKLLRYWSLGVFGATLGKVVLVDMAALDPALRVGVLMVLGVAMLGVGYWYVRNKGLLDGEGRPTPSGRG